MSEGKPTIERGRVHLLEHYRQDYVAVIPQEVDPKDLEDPSYWAPVASQFRPFGRIEARAEDGTWIAELVITSLGRNFAICKQIAFHRLTSADIDQTRISAEETKATGYEIQWKGQHNKFCVIRESDGAIVHKGEDQKSGADKWLGEHLKAISA